MPKLQFTCPLCSSPFYGWENLPDGSKRRFCKGPVVDGTCAWTCEFTWLDSEDAKYLSAGEG